VDVPDRGGLARQLRKAVDGEVRFDPGSQAIYANDASIYRQVPIGVVIPRHPGDVASALAVCREHDVPVIARGCGTGLSGQSVNAAVMFDFSKYMRKIVGLDPGTRTARVQPGVICDELRSAAAPHGLTWAVDPATHSRCTLGGMIGNNSCGTHSIMGGKTADNVIELDVLTYQGERMTVGPVSDREYQRLLAKGWRQAEIYTQANRRRCPRRAVYCPYHPRGPARSRCSPPARGGREQAGLRDRRRRRGHRNSPGAASPAAHGRARGPAGHRSRHQHHHHRGGGNRPGTSTRCRSRSRTRTAFTLR
jgi:hypothetical protein